VRGLFFGLQAAVLAVVVESVLRVGKRAIRGRSMLMVSIFAFSGIFFFKVPFPLVIAAAALIGFAGYAVGLKDFTPSANAVEADHASEGGAALDVAFGKALPPHVKPSVLRLIRVAMIGLSIWLAPPLILLKSLGPANVFAAIATFNSRMAVVTFGGAYAALAYMAQRAVEYYHWLSPQEMLVGLGFAETTPGPLISVVQFVGFMAAFRQPGSLSPGLAGTVGGILAQWCICVPSFLWIFMGAPYIESLRNNRILSAALAAITAAVVGVIANLSIWFAIHNLFGMVHEKHVGILTLQVPVLGTLNIAALILAMAAVIALFRFKIGMIVTLLGCSIAGTLMHFARWIQ
jgi:chromate transporter